MSSAARFSHHDKLRTDRAISQAYARLSTDSDACAVLAEMLRTIRRRSPALLDSPTLDSCHPGIETLINLARFSDAFVRTIDGWQGSSSSWRAIVDALAQHLLSRYRVPAFLSAAWYATDEAYGDAKRQWFVAHGNGASLRSLSLPIRLTRRMEHILLRSCAHFGIEYALRRAELLGLGADERLTDAVLAARPALELDHGEFWRSMWLFVIAHRASIDAAQIAPLIDFVHAVRHQPVAVETLGGIVMRDPPQPQFSLKGRTVRSLVRLMEEWHRGLGLVSGGLQWQRSRLRPMTVETPQDDPSAPTLSWELIELTTSTQLQAEGEALQHCVASYARHCWQGGTRIWSLRRRRDATSRSVATVEVNLEKWAVVQARGFRNRLVGGRALQVLRAWAARERLRCPF